MRDANWFERGKMAYAVGDYPQAVNLFNRAIRLNAKPAHYFSWRAKAHYALQHYEAAIEDYDQAIQRGASAEEVYFMRGRARGQLGHHYAAVANFTKLLTLNPQHAEGFYYRGHAYQALQQYLKALDDYYYATQCVPQWLDAYTQWLSVYEHLKQSATSVAAEILSLLQEQSLLLRCKRGILQQELKRHLEAVADFSQVIEAAPNHAEALCCRGVSYFEANRYEEALADYERYLALVLQANRPVSCALGFYLRGHAKSALKRYEEAIADYDQAIHWDAQYTEAFLQRGLAFFHHGNYVAARRDFKHAMDLAPDNVRPYFYHGNMQLLFKEYQAALNDFEEVLQRDPHHPEAQQQRKQVLALMSQLPAINKEHPLSGLEAPVATLNANPTLEKPTSSEPPLPLDSTEQDRLLLPAKDSKPTPSESERPLSSALTQQQRMKTLEAWPRFSCWASFLAAPHGKPSRQLRRSHSFPEFAPPHTSTDWLERLLQDPEFTQDLLTFRLNPRTPSV